MSRDVSETDVRYLVMTDRGLNIPCWFLVYSWAGHEFLGLDNHDRQAMYPVERFMVSAAKVHYLES